MNTNCLEGVRCPSCGSDSRFFISGDCMFEVTDDGSEAVGDHEWGDLSFCRCAVCQHFDAFKEFCIMDEPKEPAVTEPTPTPPPPPISDDLLNKHGLNDLP